MMNQGENWPPRVLRLWPGYPKKHTSNGLEQSVPEMKAWMLERLELAKRGLNAYLGTMTNKGQWESLMGWERLRSQLELIMARVGGLAERFRGFRSAQNMDRDRIEQLYDCEADLLDTVQNVVVVLEELSPSRTTDLLPLQGMVAEILRLLDQRESLLKRRED